MGLQGRIARALGAPSACGTVAGSSAQRIEKPPQRRFARRVRPTPLRAPQARRSRAPRAQLKPATIAFRKRPPAGATFSSARRWCRYTQTGVNDPRAGRRGAQVPRAQGARRRNLRSPAALAVTCHNADVPRGHRLARAAAARETHCQ